MNTVKLLIDGQKRDAVDQKTFTRMNPITGEVASVAAAAQPADVQAALESAEKAFHVWSKLGPTERRKRLLKAADLMDQRAEEFVLTARQETGSTNSSDFRRAAAPKIRGSVASGKAILICFLTILNFKLSNSSIDKQPPVF